MADYTAPVALQLHTTRWTSEKRAKYSHYVEQIENSNNQATNNADSTTNDTNHTNNSQSNNNDTIQLNDHIYIYTANHCTFGIIDKKSKLRIHKQYTNCVDCIGYKYGSSFTIDTHGKCTYITPSELQQPLLDTSDTINDSEFIPTANNSELSNVSAGQQQLTQTEIESMKQNTAAVDIVQSLITHSTTHNTKTEFSQVKYINKKLTKYNKVFTVYKPNLRLLAEHYYNVQTKKISYLRSDGLALLLNTANTIASRCTVVCDHYNGLVLTGVAVKHAGYGTIINLYDGQQQRIDGIQKLGLSEQYTQNILHIPMNKLYQLQQEIHNDSDDTRTDEMHITNDTTNGDTTTTNNTTTKMEPTEKQQLRQKHYNTAKQLLQAKSVNSLVIASKYNPQTLLITLLPYLMSSGTFSIHNSTIEPLTHTYDYIKYKLSNIKDTKNLLYNIECINVELYDCWLREYQVLPNRTHPDVNMTGGMGYILTGTTIVNS